MYTTSVNGFNILSRVPRYAIKESSLRHRREPYSLKNGFNAFAKRVDQCQLAQTGQADVDGNVLLLTYFMHAQGPHYHVIKLVVRQFLFGPRIM